GQGELLEVVDALGAAGRLARRLHRGQEQADQDRDDRDDDEEFDEREATPIRRRFHDDFLRESGRAGLNDTRVTSEGNPRGASGPAAHLPMASSLDRVMAFRPAAGALTTGVLVATRETWSRLGLGSLRIPSSAGAQPGDQDMTPTTRSRARKRDNLRVRIM